MGSKFFESGMKDELIQMARSFIHEKVGKTFAARPDDDSLLGNFRYVTDKGEFKGPVRIGALGQSFIAADQLHGYVLERFIKAEIPGLNEPGCPVTLVFPEKDLSPLSALMSWLLDIENRNYPLVAALPERSYLIENLRLTHRPEQTFVATASEAVVFDAFVIRKARDTLIELGDEALQKWRFVAELRDDARFIADVNSSQKINFILKKLVKANEIVGEGIWLPQPNTSDFEVLDWATRGARMGKNKLLPPIR